MSFRGSALAATAALAAWAACLPVASAAAAPVGASAGKPHRWLCRPGLARNPCRGSLTATVVTGSARIERTSLAKRRPVDCFYVYPTVSLQRTLNASLRVEPAVSDATASQASRFSQVCRVYAPLYRQLTLLGMNRYPAFLRGVDRAYAGVLSAWREYLARFNRGRGFVLIGHSQGAALLRRLMRNRIEPRRALRRRLVSALLIGGNVKVRAGRRSGGDFQHFPACRWRGQTGCVVAYSSFDRPPPAWPVVGRIRSYFDFIFRGPLQRNLRVLCVNPAALGGGSGRLRPYFPTTSLKTPWVSFPRLYRARCRRAGAASWLQVDDVAGASDDLPRVSAVLGPAWGLHLADVNLALGNLVDLVSRQAAAYLRREQWRRQAACQADPTAQECVGAGSD